jgi:DNA-binding IclR family transcriptional regulator
MFNLMQKGGANMSNTFMRVDEVAEELGVSKSYAYKIVQRLNTELKNMGYLTVAGRVSKQYFMEKVCYDKRETIRDGK